MLREMRGILRITGGGRRFALLLLLRGPVDIAFTLMQAEFLRRAFDAVGRNSTPALTSACVYFGIACVCVFLYNGTVWNFYAPFTVRMEARLRLKLYGKISALSYERVEAAPQGEWLTRLNTDVCMPFSQPIPQALCALVNIAVSSVILWLLNPAVFGWALLFVVPHIAISQLFVARVMPGLNKKTLEATAANTGELTAIVTCADVAALYSGGEYLLKRFEQSSLALLKANMRIRRRNALSWAIMPLFGMGGYLVLLAAAGGWIAHGALTFGDLTAAFQYRGGVLAGSLALINSLIAIRSNLAGVRRINQTMSEKTEEPQ